MKRDKGSDVLEQRVRTTLERFPETRSNDAALVFRVLLLYGAGYTMTPETVCGLPNVADIIEMRLEMKKS